MTDLDVNASVESDDETVLAERYGSHRGRFQVFEAPPIRRPPSAEEIAAVDLSQAADAFDYADLVEDNDEGDVRDAINEMVRAIAPGSAVTPLFAQGGADGMSLVHAWFGPNFPLFRHSHPKFGDCLYYVVAGEIIMGSRVLKAGDGFFVPNGAPYKYTAGPNGVEVLEFRAGGGTDDAPAMKLHEKSLDGIRRITETARSQHPSWQAPARVADAYDG
jgi:hypothetical protein